jgi:hypothetical protein
MSASASASRSIPYAHGSRGKSAGAIPQHVGLTVRRLSYRECRQRVSDNAPARP